MATSSITKNFIVSGKEQVEMFANAIEQSMNEPAYKEDIKVRWLNNFDEIQELFGKRMNG